MVKKKNTKKLSITEGLLCARSCIRCFTCITSSNLHNGSVKKHDDLFYLLIYLFIFFIYFWLRGVFVAARRLFSSCGERGLLFIVVRGLLIAVASLVAEHGP